jgi:hypothetical protein
MTMAQTNNGDQVNLLRSYMQSSQQGQQLVDEAGKLLRGIRGLLYMCMLALSITMEVFLRRRLGERYLNITICVMGLGACFAVMLVDAVVGPVLFVGVAAGVIVHRVGIVRRRRTLDRWHSRSPGISWEFYRRLDKNDRRIVQLWEPATVALPGVVLLSLEFIGGAYFIAAAVALIVKTSIEFAAARGKLLDAIDSQIESQHLAEAIQGTDDPEQTEGFVVPGASRWSDAERASVTDAYRRLSPDLDNLIGSNHHLAHWSAPESEFPRAQLNTRDA